MRRRELLGAALVAAAGTPLLLAGRANADESSGVVRVFLSSYTSGGGAGIEVGKADLATGALTITGKGYAGADPSWITAAPNGRYLYANNELVPDGTVSALGLGTTGVPYMLNLAPTGQGPVHVSVHPSGRYLFSSLYTSGQVVVHPIYSDGRVGNPVHVEQHPTDPALGNPIVHQTVTDPSGGWIVACDLGIDSVFVYKVDLSTGKLQRIRRVQLAAGAGPRHIAFDPTGRYAYTANEQDSTITAYTWNSSTGGLVAAQTLSTVLSPPPTRNYPGEVIVSPDGRFVYLSNRGANTIAVFAVKSGGLLSLIETPSCGGNWPRNIALDPTGKWLYVGNQLTNEVVWFERDVYTGKLIRQAGKTTSTAVSCILFA